MRRCPPLVPTLVPTLAPVLVPVLAPLQQTRALPGRRASWPSGALLMIAAVLTVGCAGAPARSPTPAEPPTTQQPEHRESSPTLYGTIIFETRL